VGQSGKQRGNKNLSRRGTAIGNKKSRRPRIQLQRESELRVSYRATEQAKKSSSLALWTARGDDRSGLTVWPLDEICAFTLANFEPGIKYPRDDFQIQNVIGFSAASGSA